MSVKLTPKAEVRDLLASHPDFALHRVIKLIGLLRASTVQVRRPAPDDDCGRITLLQRLPARG
jgi:hypothetical protein